MRNEFTIVTIYVFVVSYGLSNTMYEVLPDPRVQEWFLIKDWGPIIFILVTYLAAVFLGPILMKNRQPFEIRKVIIVYNAVQVLLSLYISKEFAVTAWHSGYSLRCQGYDPTPNPLSVRMAGACWWFFFSKIVDTLDTGFFVLRKKNNQITFLHVYHHFSMIMNWWLGAKHLPGGQVFFQCMVNSFVHVIMYFYYFLSAFGPHMQKHLWWKRYLTQLQLIQFCTIVGHTIIGMTATDCDFPFVVNWYIIVYCCTLISLFTNFYVNAYRKSKKIEINSNGSALKEKEQVSSVHQNGFTVQQNTSPIYQNGTVIQNGHINGIVKENGLIHRNGYKNGYANGHVNGHINGYTNGHANGHTNGHANGHANGYVTLLENNNQNNEENRH